MAKKYWLVKSEPEVFSITDLRKAKNQTTCWDGVRNYQARNYMRDEMKKGDEVLFYHSNSEPPAVTGLCEVVKEGYPDYTAFDPEDKHYDPKSKKENPAWMMVDIKLKSVFVNQVTLPQIKGNKKLSQMKLLQRGSRLSVIPLEKEEFEEIIRMSAK